ncbi:MAG: apolipoprotein N-acyltransferase, partial [Planctomycetota bacterium]
MTGFGWNLLAHSQWEWTTFIQMADLGGAYLVSAAIALGNAALALTVPNAVLARFGLLLGEVKEEENADVRVSLRFHPVIAGLGTAAVLAAALLYGTLRRAGDAFPAGPRVALIQTDDPSSLRGGQSRQDDRIMGIYALTEAAVPYQSDLILWPESAFAYPIAEAVGELTDAQIELAADPIPATYFRDRSGELALSSYAERFGAYLLTGGTAMTVTEPDDGGPLPVRLDRYGSALMAAPSGGSHGDGLVRGAYLGRYDKRHRVVFGEYIPDLPGLASLTPFTEDEGQAYGISAGDQPVAFLVSAVGTSPDGRQPPQYAVAPLICYEDTVPHLVRDTVNSLKFNGAGEETGPDVLAVLSNDGWFNDSAEQEQHLAVSLFRAVETRTPLVRASNTGVSAVIDGDGVPRTPAAFLERLEDRSIQAVDLKNLSAAERAAVTLPDDRVAVLIADVPLDPRGSLYLLTGDLFALLCTLAAAVGFLLNCRRSPRPGGIAATA